MSSDHANAILTDLFTRSLDGVVRVVEGMEARDLLWQPDSGANSIAWITWHIGRMEDAQIAHLSRGQPVWTSQGWVDRFDLPYPRDAHGYGQTAQDVRAFRLTNPSLLTGYYRAVHARTLDVVSGLGPEDLDRVIDPSWDPPVTVAVRLVSIADDAAQHVGQAGYLKGMLSRR